MPQLLGHVFDVEEFAVFDGPGIRTALFLGGCPLRCAWCHNPEGFEPGPKTLTPEAAARRVLRGRRILESSGGGVTFTGGEALTQPDFVLAVCALLPGVHKAVETSGCVPPEDFSRVTAAMDLVMLDLKLADPALHRRYTGADNGLIRENLARLIASGRPFIARTPLIPGVTDTEENLSQIARWVKGAPGLVRVELLPYNRAAGAKYKKAGRVYAPPFDEEQPVQIRTDLFEKEGVPCAVL